MEELLRFLREGNRSAIQIVSFHLFMTKDGRVNEAQISEFEAFAPCSVSAFRIKTIDGWKLCGTIRYMGTLYSID